MYMFFWFFKQLYYCLRRIFKSGILLLILFFIAFLFIFVKPSFASTDVTGFTYNNTYYEFPESYHIPNNNNSYVIVSYDNMTSIRIIYPYNNDGELVTLTTPTISQLPSTNNVNAIRSLYNNSLSQVYWVEIPYTNGSFGSWQNSGVVNNFIIAFQNGSHTIDFIECHNFAPYTPPTGRILSSMMPDLVRLTDNILIWTYNNSTYMAYTANSTNYFYNYSYDGNLYCYTSGGVSVSFDVYKYNSNQNKFTLYSDDTNYVSNYNPHDLDHIYYTTNSFKNTSANETKTYNIGYGDIFSYLYNDPYITTGSTYIENWSFNTLDINLTDLSTDGAFWLLVDYNDTEFDIPLNQYISTNNNSFTASIPKKLLTNNIVVRSGDTINFSLQYRYNLQNLVYDLGSYTFDLSSTSATTINEDNDKQLLSDLNNEQKETTNAINNLNDTITNSDISDTSIYLPQDDSNDITANGLNNIFTSIYNAFCTGTAQDIIFPIPFTNKNITLQASYVRNMLTSNGATWIITIIEAFWWYLISRFIIKDITNKITKIKSGNIEDIENSNIKGDML